MVSPLVVTYDWKHSMIASRAYYRITIAYMQHRRHMSRPSIDLYIITNARSLSQLDVWNTRRDNSDV